MEKIEKGLQILMVLSVILLIIIGFAVIMIGHATDYRFIFSTQDFSNLVLSVFGNGKFL